MTVKYPQVPQDLSALSDDELETLRLGLHQGIKLVTDGAVALGSAEDKASLKAATQNLQAVKTEQKSRKDAAAAEAADLEAAREALQEEDDEEAEEEVVEDEPEDDGETEVIEPDEVIEPASANTPAVTTSNATVAVVKPIAGVGTKDEPRTGLQAQRFVAMDGAPGKRAGDAYTGFEELAEIMLERSRTIGRGDGLVPLAALFANYEADRKLEGLDPMQQLRRMAGGTAGFESPELTAAMCAPTTPYYGMDCMSTTRRPVFNSLPQFPAPRGGVSIPTSPELADITGGYGFWTRTEDADVANQTKAACITVECPTMTDYYFYAVYRCMTVQNFMQMTWPEVVEAWLNHLAARTARAAEIQLLDLMAANVNRVTAPGIFTSAYTAISTQLLAYLAGAQERGRWDTFDDGMEMWAPRWLQYFLRIDLERRRVTDGSLPSVSNADVNRLFTDLGFNVHWFIDTPTWGVAAPTQGTGNPVQLVSPPASVKVLVAPRGKFALIDRGELRIGLEGNNVVRDLTTLKKNQFTMFFETFEGIVDTNSCPADLITIPTCFSGIQVADQSVDCYGFADAVS